MKPDKFLPLLPAFNEFINAMKSGKRRLPNGNKISPGTLQNHINTYRILTEFSKQKSFDLQILILQNPGKKMISIQKKYWQRFYNLFTDYLYDDLDHYDAYAGSIIKNIRTFFNYLSKEKNYLIGQFHKSFYIPKETIEVIALNPSQMRFLIQDEQFDKTLPANIKRAKDFFLFGCTVALRYSDLKRLKSENLIKKDAEYYLQIASQKTNTFTNIKLPPYAVEITKRYSRKKSRLLPPINMANLEVLIKKLAELAGWNSETPKLRQKRNKAVIQFRDDKTKTHYRFCDLLTTHTMRRTAITTMLSLGMQEQLVKKISGHSPNSKDFHKYVAFSQEYLDRETGVFFDKLTA